MIERTLGSDEEKIGHEVVAAAKVVLVEVEIEVESISITTFFSDCPLLGRTLAKLNTFLQIQKEIAPWQGENWPEGDLLLITWKGGGSLGGDVVRHRGGLDWTLHLALVTGGTSDFDFGHRWWALAIGRLKRKELALIAGRLRLRLRWWALAGGTRIGDIGIGIGSAGRTLAGLGASLPLAGGTLIGPCISDTVSERSLALIVGRQRQRHRRRDSRWT